MAKGQSNPYINQSGFGVRKQVGGSLIGSQGTFIVPIEDAARVENYDSSNTVKVKLISPAQQVVEQAKSEIIDIPKAKRTLKRNSKSKNSTLTKISRTARTSPGSKQRRPPTKSNKNTTKGIRKSQTGAGKRKKGQSSQKASKKKPITKVSRVQGTNPRDIFNNHGNS